MPAHAHAKAPAREKVRQARQGAYRDLILEAAQRVFAEKGYAEAKVADIAQATGVATGTVYPVAYVNAGASTFLELGANLAPSEVYSIGGAINVQ